MHTAQQGFLFSAAVTENVYKHTPGPKPSSAAVVMSVMDYSKC